MNTAEHTAVQAYYRLTQTLRASAGDPDADAALVAAAAHEANQAFARASLLGRPEHEILALVAEVYPEEDL